MPFVGVLERQALLAAEAAGAALLAALAHTAVLDAVRGRAAVPLAQDAAGDAELEFLHKTAAALGLGVELLDLTGDGPAPVVLAREPLPLGPGVVAETDQPGDRSSGVVLVEEDASAPSAMR